SKTMHIGHGLMRFASGKMSSRTGNVITAESLLADIREMVAEKIASRGFGEGEASEISDIIAVGAIKYSILRSAIGSDIIFDSAKSISFEGDSGPYLQYSAVRAASILEKAMQEGISQVMDSLPEKVSLVEKLLIRFPEVIARAKAEYAPQGVANYLMSLAGAFNSFYATQVIVDKKDKLSPYYVALTKAFRQTMVNGLWVLGIKVPEGM
ncbi:MAG: DALR anticodon-binding domain-containing protein, partial [Candidatus Taylorbacteria bacterium]|nr:DALR anticodon-binding domain-containing protein [Candidatus Taylorbacteria bacterium]